MTDWVSSDRLAAVLQDEGRALLELARGADLTRPVPGCPEWTVGDLLAHLASVYRWVGLIVGERRQERPSAQERSALDTAEADGQDPLRAFESAHAGVLAVLGAAPADLDCWTIWPAPEARHYWIRRQAHETLVHRVDVRDAVVGATRGSADVEPAIAADGVDEMVMGFARRYRDRLRSPVQRTISLHATDVDRRWWIRLSPAEPEFGRGETGDPGQTVVQGRSDELLLLLWNRRAWEGLTVSGDESALSVWRRETHL